MSKGKWHPSRTSGMQKQTRERDANKLLQEKKKIKTFEPIDLSKPDWSIKNK